MWGYGGQKDSLTLTANLEGGVGDKRRNANSGIPILACCCPPLLLAVWKPFSCRQMISQAYCWEYLE